MTTTQTSFAGGVVLLSSTLDDATATQLGLKQYLHGTTYNGGNAPTVTCAQSGFTVNRAVFIPYQCQDGSWRLRFNLSATFTAATITSISVSVNGILSKNVSNYFQPISAITVGASAAYQSAYIGPSSANLNFFQGSGTQSGICFSGDVELDAKPTWAY